MFRHREDRLPVAIVAAIAVTDLAAYLLVDSLWALIAYYVVMTIPKGIVSAWNHHHQHALTFRSTTLNRLLEVVYGLLTGMPTNMWVLHHNLGHHPNFLDQRKDQSAWKRKDGSQMGELEYTIWIALTAYPRALRVGKRFPRLLTTFLIFGLLTWAIAGTLTWVRPTQGLLIYLMPMVSSVLFTTWVTYDHHAGLDTTEPMRGSFNIMNTWYNRLTGNLGYHTAHHHRPALHWSKLPALHARIEKDIPAECYTATIFDRFLPDPPSKARPESTPATSP